MPPSRKKPGRERLRTGSQPSGSRSGSGAGKKRTPPSRSGAGASSQARRSGPSKAGSRSRGEAGPSRAGSRSRGEAGPSKAGSRSRGEAGPSRAGSRSRGEAGPSKAGSRSRGEAGPSRAGSRSRGEAGPSKAGSRSRGEAGPSKAGSRSRGEAGPSKAGSRSRGEAGPSKAGSRSRGEAGPSKAKPQWRTEAGPQEWGRIARRGAGGLVQNPGSRRSPDAPGASPRGQAAAEEAPVALEPPPSAERVPGGKGPPARERRPLPQVQRRTGDPHVELVRTLGETLGHRATSRFDAAARAFRDERFDDCRRLLASLARDASGVADVRELYGLAMYRTGRFKEAARELEAFRELSGSVEQHPVLADCHRALGRWADVDALWQELGAVSPSAALVTEGRIVLAGAMSDRGEMPQAIRTLDSGWRVPSRPRPHHLRRAYALADLYDRAGRSPRARELFRWVASHDPDLADVSDRVRALG